MKLGHVAIDGSKMRANASHHKAMGYERMCAQEQAKAAAATVEAKLTERRQREQETGKKTNADKRITRTKLRLHYRGISNLVVGFG